MDNGQLEKRLKTIPRIGQRGASLIGNAHGNGAEAARSRRNHSPSAPAGTEGSVMTAPTFLDFLTRLRQTQGLVQEKGPLN